MSVIRTDQWLLDSYDQPMDICKKLKLYFEGASAIEIYEYLAMNGMYQPEEDEKKVIKTLQNNRVWELVQNEQRRLQKEWDGPDVPVFIFPSDTTNPEFNREFNSMAGLAFKDKLFLFIAGHHSGMNIKSLFTHEYNHVCRLAKWQKHEEHYVLLDTIILEGLAENAVRERLGEKFTAKWTVKYSDEELERLWKTLVLPNRSIINSHPKHNEILFGFRHYPKMLGYCIGYYLVRQFIKEKKLTSKDLLPLDSTEIARILY